MTRRQLFILAVSYGLLGLASWLLAMTLTLRSDLSFVFPQDADPDVQLLAERLQKGPAAGLLLMAVSGGSLEDRIEIGNALATDLADSGRFDFVANGRPRPQGSNQPALFEKLYLLNPPVTAEDFSPAALRRGLEDSLAALAGAGGAATQDRLPSDPTGRLRRVMDFWSSQAQSQRAPGFWLSGDGESALLMAATAGSAFDLDKQTETLDFIDERFQALRGERPLVLAKTGPAVFAVASSRLIRQEMQKLTTISVFLVIGILILVFRTPSLVAVLLLPLGFGVLAGTAAVQGLFGEIHGITLAFGGTLIGVAVDYPIHLASHSATARSTRSAMQSIWPTLRLGLLTTLLGFLPLTLSSFPGLSQLGVFEIVGLTTAALVTRYLLPGILQPVGGATRADVPDLQVKPWAGRRLLRPIVLALALGALAYLVWQGPKVWETDLRKLSPTPAEARALDRQLRGELGAVDVRYLLVLRRPTMEAVLRDSEGLAESLQPLIDNGRLAGVDMAAHYLPSQAEQAARQAALPTRPVLERALAQASEGLPFRPGTFAPFLEDVTAAKDSPLLTYADFEAAGLAWRLAPLLFRQGDDWVGLLVPRGLTDPAALAAFATESKIDGVGFLDLKTGSEALVADYRNEALEWLALGAVIAMGILWLGLRDSHRVGRIVAPIGLTLVFTVALLSAFGVALSLFHLLSLLLVAGVGLDYALFFEHQGRHREAAAPTLRANLVCAGTTVSVFTVLALSPIPVLHGIGLTVALGAAIAFALAFFFTETARCRDS
ncbi:MAG TPA: MMPL family transporter [Kiloniellaceae bacterium]|nr:MMPL family transporter [Kiloniellaceae bacterium]